MRPMENGFRKGTALTLLLGVAVIAPVSSAARISRQRPAAYRILSELRQGDAVRSVARTLAASEIAASAPPRAFEELGDGVAWLPQAPAVSCAEATREVRLDDRRAGKISFQVRVRCAASPVRGGSACVRYRIAVQGEGRAVAAPDGGMGVPIAPEWREIAIRGEGEMISCAGETVARSAALCIEREVALQPWAGAADAASESQRIDIAWAALP